MAINIPIITEFADAGLKSARGAFQNFKNEVASADGAMNKFKAGAGAAFDTVKANAGAFAIAGGAAVAAFAGKAIAAASDFEESSAKIGEIFGEAADSIFDFAEDAAQALGQSKQSVLDAAGTFGTFGKAAGLAGEDLSTFSNDFTALASDLASFNNTSPEEAVQALGAALRGESEPLRRYGILLDDASMRQKALELGIIATTKNALTPQQKILAAQALIFEQSSDAQGDFERTSGSLANQQRILQAELANVSIEIGQKLLPVAVQFVRFANDNLVPVVKTLSDALGFFARGIEESTEGTNSWWQGLIKALNPIDAYVNALQGDDGAIDSTKQLTEAQLNMAWRDGTRQMIIATNALNDVNNALKDATISTEDLSAEWDRFLGTLDKEEAWNNLQDKLARTKEASYEAFIKGTAESARRATSAQADLIREVAKYVDELGTIPPEVQSRIIGQLERGAFDEAIGLLNVLRQGVSVPITGTVSGIPVGPGETPSEVRPPGFRPPAKIPSGKIRIPALPPSMRSGVTVNVAGSVISEGQLVETIRKGLVNSQRNGAGLVYSNR